MGELGKERSYLRRLAPEGYRGLARVHWSLTIKGRRTGWLDALFHTRWREMLVHSLSRYDLCCPLYCLMPDHMHILWLGFNDSTSAESDQRKAMRHLRQQVNGLLLRPEGYEFQTQAYDHVLREADGDPDGLSAVATYIRANPVRARLCQQAELYPFAGCVVPGYPEMDINHPEYWERFWRVYHALRESTDS